MSNVSTIPEFPKAIYEQLRASKVNGFPFMAYTGIKKYAYDQNTLYLLEIPKNPNHIKTIKVIYDYGRDLYNVEFYNLKKKLLNLNEKLDGIYADQLSDLIVDKMGVR